MKTDDSGSANLIPMILGSNLEFDDSGSRFELVTIELIARFRIASSSDIHCDTRHHDHQKIMYRIHIYTIVSRVYFPQTTKGKTYQFNKLI